MYKVGIVDSLGSVGIIGNILSMECDSIRFR